MKQNARWLSVLMLIRQPDSSRKRRLMRSSFRLALRASGDGTRSRIGAHDWGVSSVSSTVAIAFCWFWAWRRSQARECDGREWIPQASSVQATSRGRLAATELYTRRPAHATPGKKPNDRQGPEERQPCGERAHGVEAGQ